MTDPTANINPKNRPYRRRINAVNQPLGDSLLPYSFAYGHTVGLATMGPNRKARRREARENARPKNQRPVAPAPKRFTMVPGAPAAPKKRFNLWKWLAEFFQILFSRSIPWSKRGLRG